MLVHAITAWAAAFLLGSIPFGYLLVRLRTGGDVRRSGSGNIGATNVARTAGAALGLATLGLDAAKGFVAIALADLLAFHGLAQPVAFAATAAPLPAYDASLVAGALLLVVAGHMFTPWLGGRGGKGVATALGAFLALAPWALLAATVVFGVFVALTRIVSLASIAASVALPPLMAWHYRGRFPEVIYGAAVAVAVLVVARHQANLSRLRAGNEPRLGARKRPA